MIPGVSLTVCLSLFLLFEPYSCLKSGEKFDPKALENIFYNDIREVVKEITGDADNLDRLVKQLREIREDAKRNKRSIDYTMAQLDPEFSGDDQKISTTEEENNANRGAPDSSQPGGNPLVTLQNRINAFFDTFTNFFTRFRSIFRVNDTVNGNNSTFIQQSTQRMNDFLKRFRNIFSRMLTNETVS